MNPDVDPTKVLYAVGILFGVAAVAYFARDVVFDLSITVRAALLFVAFLGLLLGGLATDRRGPDVVLFVLGAATYLAFLVYSVTRFDVGASGTFLALAVSAVFFLALGYLLRERDVALAGRTVRALGLVLLLAALVLVGADVAASGVTYEVTVTDAAAVGDRGTLEVGTLTVENRFVFREPLDLPRVGACVYAPGVGQAGPQPRPVDVRVGAGPVPDTVGGSTTLTAGLDLRVTPDERAAFGESVPVERVARCDPARSEPGVAVVVGEAATRPLPP